MDEDLYSSVEVTYQTCTCSAAAQARSPVAASERRSMNRRATRDVVDGQPFFRDQVPTGEVFAHQRDRDRDGDREGGFDRKF